MSEAVDSLRVTPEPPRDDAPGEQEVLIRLEADVAGDGTFGRRVLEVTPRVVRVVEPGDAVSLQIPIADIKSARNEPLVGGARSRR